MQFVPTKVFTLLGTAINKVVLPGTPSGPLYKGALTSVLAIGDDYKLWESRDENGKAHIKVAKKNALGTFELFAELKITSFTNNAQSPQAVTNIGNLINASKAYSEELGKQKKTPTANGTALLKTLQQAVTNLQNLVKTDIEHDACVALEGCFAAGTKLWTPEGYRNVEEIGEGEKVFSRNEWDPHGAIESKVVEMRFERTGRILHLHANGELIRTTPEHPFYEMKRGWIEAGALAAGNRIRTDSGWVTVEEVFDTGTYETVYNLRVADHRTYFIGEEGWRERVWAHNTYTMKRTGTALPTGVSGGASATSDVTFGKYYQKENRELRPSSQRTNPETLKSRLNQDAGATLVFTPASGSAIVQSGFALESTANYNVESYTQVYLHLKSKLETRLGITTNAQEQALIQALLSTESLSLGMWIRPTNSHAEGKALGRLLDKMLAGNSDLMPLFSGTLTFVVDGVYDTSPSYGGPCVACTSRILGLKALLGTGSAVKSVYNQSFTCPQWITLQFNA